jgi:serine/threonine-protein kinase
VAPGDLAAGSQIAGYQIEEQIGRGGMAVVYRAFDPRLGRSVALKILAPELARDAAFRERFGREMRAAAAVDHPHIVPVFDAGEATGILFIAMRYVAGQDLRTLLDRERMLPPARVAHIVSQVASALDEAHARGLVHRDVKPGNMLIGTVAGSGQPDHVYLSDFGLSKQSLSSTSLTATGQFLGTLDYMAPEQVEGRPIDGRADLYALACSAFEMLAGTPPFKRDEGVAVLWAQLSAPTPSLQAIRPELPSAVDQVMGRALAKSPGDRYQTCTAFAAALRAGCGLGASDGGPGHWPAAAPPAWAATEMAHVHDQPTAVPTAPTEPQPAAPASFPTAPQPAAPASYPTGPAAPQPGPHPSWPEGPPPGRYVVPPPAPGRYTAGTPAPQRRRSWTGAALVVACIVLLGIAGAVFAVLRGHGTSTSNPPSPPPARTTTSPAAVTSPPVNPAPSGPAATVQAYVAAINAHDYPQAWNLGGNHTGQPYSMFVQGYSGTAHDSLTVLSVSGNVVTAQLTATQTDGTVKTYQGTYTVSNGNITIFDIRQTG